MKIEQEKLPPKINQAVTDFFGRKELLHSKKNILELIDDCFDYIVSKGMFIDKGTLTSVILKSIRQIEEKSRR